MNNNRKNPYPLHSTDNPILSDYADSLDIFKDKPFWIWNQVEHNIKYHKTGGQCCFNHIVGLPTKNNKQYPIFPFQEQIYDAVEQNDNIWILKSRGIGATTFLIRWLSWKILSSNELDHKSIFIISGTREQFANHIKKQIQDIFTDKFPLLRLESKYTELWLKRTWIKVFPTRNIEMVRGYTDVSIIWVDESDHMEPSVQEELFYSIGPYQEKSNAKIILSSTANRPDGLMATIEQQPGDKWKKLKLDYTYGLGSIYDPKEIAKMKHDVEFPREMECKYLGKTGNTFKPIDIDLSVKRYDDFKLSQIPIENNRQVTFVGIDPASGSSNTGIVATQHLIVTDPITNRNRDVIRIVYADEFVKPSSKDIIDLCHSLRKTFGYANTYFYVDSAAAMFIRDFKSTIGEDPYYDVKNISIQSNHILPVVFSVEGRTLLSNLEHLVNKGYLAIDPKYDKVITSLRTAYSTEWKLDKEVTVSDDSLDALRLSCKGYNIK